MSKPRILIVEDDVKIASILKDYLEQDNFRVAVLNRGDEVMPTIRTNPPDAILLDILLPGEDGRVVFKKVRAVSNFHILMITAKIKYEDCLAGLEMGADDYICKPFLPREVVARVKAVLRRANLNSINSGMLVFGPITINVAQRRVSIYESELQLTPAEFGLLKLFISRPGHVFTRNDLIASVWGDSFIGYDRTIDSHICNLRKKISDQLPAKDLIHTVYSIGYSFGAGPES